jgi:DnaK suppressor protein
MASPLSAKQPELSRLKGGLKAKQAELLSGLGNREGIAIEPAADDLDKIQYATERDITIAKLHLDSVLLRAVRAALTRMTGGHYGACLHCDGSITEKRLEAVPWTPYCIKCQAAADRGEFEDLEEGAPKGGVN